MRRRSNNDDGAGDDGDSTRSHHNQNNDDAGSGNRYTNNDPSDPDSPNEDSDHDLLFDDAPWMEINQVIDEIGYGPYQQQIFYVTVFAAVSEGMADGINSVLLNIWQAEWHLTGTEIAFAADFIYFGMMIGSFFGGKLGDTYGKLRWTRYFLCISTLFGTFSLIMADYFAFITFRLFVGVGLGGAIANSYSLYMEALPSRSRGSNFGYSEVFWAVGAVVIVLIAWALTESFGR